MSQLMQENSSQNATKSASFPSKESAYIASSSGNKNRKMEKKDNEVVSWYCNKVGHYKSNVRSKSARKPRKKVRGNLKREVVTVVDDTEKGKIAALSKSYTK